MSNAILYSKIEMKLLGYITRAMLKGPVKIFRDGRETWFFVNQYMAICLLGDKQIFNLERTNIIENKIIAREIKELMLDLEILIPTGVEVSRIVPHADGGDIVKLMKLVGSNLGAWVNIKFMKIFDSRCYTFYTSGLLKPIFCRNNNTGQFDGFFLPFKLGEAENEV